MKAGYNTGTLAAVALAASTAKTVLAVIAPAQFGVDLIGYTVGLDGVTASATPGVLEIVSFTTDGTGTGATVNQNYGRAITAGFTSKYNYTVEPTTATVLYRTSLTPNGGTIVYEFPRDRTPDCAVSNLIGLRLTYPAIVNVNATLTFERC